MKGQREGSCEILLLGEKNGMFLCVFVYVGVCALLYIVKRVKQQSLGMNKQ